MQNVCKPGTPLYVELSEADAEYSLTLPDSCVEWSFQCRDAVDIRYAFVTGKVATPTEPYLTCKSGQVIQSPPHHCFDNADTPTIYFATDSTADPVVEVLTFVSA